MSRVKSVPATIRVLAVRPTTNARSAGGKPVPGRRTPTLSSVRMLPGANVAQGHQAFAGDGRGAAFGSRRDFAAIAQGRLDDADAAHQRRQFGRFRGGLVIRAGHGAIEREMLFDDAGTRATAASETSMPSV